MNFKLFCEEFDSISDFLLNPNHRHKKFDQLLDEFQKSGGKILGQGSHATVYSHPNWKYILKVFSQDSCYLKFARFAAQHPHKSLPVFYGPPQKVIPMFTRPHNQSTLYLVRTEMLYPVKDRQMLKEINSFIPFRLNIPLIKQTYNGNPYEQQVLEIIKKYPQAESLFEASKLIQDNVKECHIDIAENNIMQRKDGTLVLNDPLWEGSNPYADHQRMMDMETDRYGGEEYQEPKMVVGGKLPRKERVKKYKPKPINPNEIPF